MGGVEVYLGQGDVAFDHLQSGVAEQALEFESVTAVAQEIDSEGVTKTMGVDVLDAGALAQAAEEVAQAGGGDGDQGLGGSSVGAGKKVTPNGFEGAGVNGDDALFLPFAGDFDVAVALVHILDEEAGGAVAGVGAEFGGADAGIEEKQDDGPVAVGGGAGVSTLAFAGAGIGLGAGADGEQRFNILPAQRLDGGLFGARWFDDADDVVFDQALA